MTQDVSADKRHDSLLDSVVDEIATRLNNGESVDISHYVAMHPNIEQQLRDAYDALAGVWQFREEGEEAEKATQRHRHEDFEAPKEIGDFRILREIGRGGMGIVYEAEQLSLQRGVALKVLPYAAMLDQRQLRRFKNEARAAAMLKHPDIVSVYAVGCERGIHFYAMELVEGRSLADVVAALSSQPQGAKSNHVSGAASTDANESCLLDTRPIERITTSFSRDRHNYYRSVAQLGATAASALQYAHSEGVIHRDIKPSNLLIDRDGKLWVTDFGLARIHSGDDITATGDFVGTLRYMSPEQVTGDRVVDQRTDVYSLGLTLYEMISGSAAFKGNDRHSLAQQIVDGDLKPLYKIDHGVPRDLDTIIQKAVSREAEGRYSTAGAMSEDLRRFLDRRPITARRVSRVHHLWRWSCRNPMVATLLSALLLLLSVVSIAGVGGSVHLSNVAKDIKRKLYASDMRRAHQLWQEGDTFQTIKTLERHMPEKGDADERHFEWFYLRSLCDQLSPKWTFGHPVSAYDATFSPDGMLLATCTWTPQVYLWDVATGKKRHELLGHAKGVSRVLFSPNGKTLISASYDGTIRFWDVASGNQTDMIGDPAEPKFDVRDLLLSPDGRYVIAVCGYPRGANHGVRRVVAWDSETKQQVRQLDGLGNADSSVACSPDSRYLAAGSEDGKILVWDCQSWQLCRGIDAHTSAIQSVAFAPNGATVASASFIRHSGFTRAEIKIWDPSDWTVLHTIQHHDARIKEIDYSPDGRWLLVASIDYNVSIWNVEDGKCVKSFRPHAARVFAARMSPDSTYLATASADNFVKVWNVAELIRPSDAQNVYEDISDYVHSLTFADDGKSVIAADISGEITKRDTTTGMAHYRFTVAPPTDWRIEVCVSPDNQWLAVASGRKTNNEESGEIEIRNVETGELTLKTSTVKAYLHGLQFSPDGKRLAFGSRRVVFVFDRESGDVVQQLEPFDYVKQVKWSPTGRQLAVAENTGWTSLFDTSDYRRIKRLQTDDGWGTIGLDYSPDGSEFATGGGDREVKIWDSSSFVLLDTFDECPDWIATVSYSADGRRLMTTGKDGVLRVWYRELGECLLTLDTGPLWTMNGQFSPNGKMIASATDVLRIWRCKDHFKPVVIHLPPNQPCYQAMELSSTNVANSDAGAANVD